MDSFRSFVAVLEGVCTDSVELVGGAPSPPRSPHHPKNMNSALSGTFLSSSIYFSNCLLLYRLLIHYVGDMQLARMVGMDCVIPVCS